MRASDAAVEGDIRHAAGTVGTILRLHRDRPDRIRECYSLLVDPDGRYRLEGVPAGTLQGVLLAKLLDGPSIEQEVTVVTHYGQTTRHDIDIQP